MLSLRASAAARLALAVVAAALPAISPSVGRAAPPAAVDAPRAVTPADAGVAPSATGVAVAVLYFDVNAADEGLKVLRKGLAQMLVTDLTGVAGARLVERDRVEAVFQEQQLHRSGKVDRATATRVGKLLGARLLVLGSVFALGPALRLDARVVDAETGSIVVAAKATARDDDILAAEAALATALGQGLERYLAPPAAKRSGVDARDAAPGAGPRAMAERRSAQPKLRRPARLSRALAERYARALDAKDRGDKATASAGLREVLREEPAFELAYADLQSLAR